MNLVLVVLTAPTSAAGAGISTQILADILWANADPVDGLEHINVRAGPEPGSQTVGVFLLPGDSADDTGTDTDPDTAVHTVLDLCHRALNTSPVLAGWRAAVLPRPAASIADFRRSS